MIDLLSNSNILYDYRFNDGADVMRHITIQFISLAPGESQGDPGPGGWRRLRLRRSRRRGVSPLSVGEGARVVASRLVKFQLRQPIGIVAQRLATSRRFEPQRSEGGDV